MLTKPKMDSIYLFLPATQYYLFSLIFIAKVYKYPSGYYSSNFFSNKAKKNIII